MPHGAIWTTKLYGPLAYKPKYGQAHQSCAKGEELSIDPLLVESPWPAQSSNCFDWLNRFVERCNDVLELLESSKQFNALRDAAAAGATGHDELDALIRQAHTDYCLAMNSFLADIRQLPSLPENVLLIDEGIAAELGLTHADNAAAAANTPQQPPAPQEIQQAPKGASSDPLSTTASSVAKWKKKETFEEIFFRFRETIKVFFYRDLL